MAVVFTLPTRSYPSGVTSFGPYSVPQGATQYEMVVDISQMLDPATSYDFSFDISYDGGATWQFWNEGGRDGGPLARDRQGNPVTTQKFGAGMYNPTSANRKVRGSVTVVGPITIGATLSVS